MCGLYGIINKFKNGYFTDTEANHFFDMGWITSLRGRDSSSIWGISREHPERYPKTWKAIGDSSYLQFGKAGPQITKFLTREAMAVFGHGRKATVGKVSLENQHPFNYKHIVLMHNGTISGGLEGKEQEVEVDSHALTIQIAEKGVEETLRRVEGAFAIIAYDLNKQKIIIARNHQRDLHYIESSDLVFIMTDKGALEYIVQDRMGRKNDFAKPFLPMHIYEIEPGIGGEKSVKIYKFEKIWPVVSHTTTVTDFNYSEYPYHNHETAEPKPNLFDGWVKNDLGILVKQNDLKFSKRSVDDTHWKLKKSQMACFIVEDFKQLESPQTGEKRGNWKYWGMDLLGNSIVFFSNSRQDKFLDSMGRAPIVGAVPEVPDDTHKELTYIVAQKEIKWMPGWDDLTENERSGVMATGKCEVCGHNFNENDINQIIVNMLNPVKVTHGECETALYEQTLRLQNEANSHIPV